MKKFVKYLIIVFLVLFVTVVALLAGTHFSLDPDVTYELRGRYKPSPDGKTYLVVEDDNGASCGTLLVNNKKWSHGLNNKGEVDPGDYSIECGTKIRITILTGTTYYFNYWGP